MKGLIDTCSPRTAALLNKQTEIKEVVETAFYYHWLVAKEQYSSIRHAEF